MDYSKKAEIIRIFDNLVEELCLVYENSIPGRFFGNTFFGYVEGPSGTTIKVEKDFDFKKEQTEKEIRDILIKEIIEVMSNFDPGKEYEEQYEEDFGPSAEELEEEIWADEEFFSDKALSMKMDTNRITEDDDVDYMLVVREKELEKEIKELDKKKNKLWQDALADKDFINELEKVNSYDIYFVVQHEKHLEFYIMKKYKPLVVMYITMTNGIVEPENNNQENLIDLADYSIEKYRVTKELISEVNKKSKQKQIHRIEETIEKIKNIDK